MPKHRGRIPTPLASPKSLPRQEQFPARSPITGEERDLLAFIEIHPTQAREAFALKAAEVVMSGRSWDMKKRAEALTTLFPNRLGKTFAEALDPEKHKWGRDAHNELLRLIAADPGQREVIIRTYKAMFKGDTWVNEISFP